MTTRAPMPSPSGRNAERLYLPERLAADSATSTSASTRALSQFQIFLNQKLTSPDDQAQVESLIDALLEAISPDADPDQDADHDDEAQDRRKLAGDRIRTMKRDAKRVTFDSLRRSEEKMARLFPDAVMPRQLGRR